MSRNGKMARPALTAWKAESVRLTIFPSPEAVVTPEAWWKDLMGGDATVQTVRKGRLVRRDQGEALGGILTLAVQPGRIDWTLAPKGDEELGDFPELGGAVESVPRFVEALARWFPSSPPAVRLALGVTAWIPARDHEEAYSLLDALLPAVEVDAGSADLLYRINRPRVTQLSIEGLRINRLSTWTPVQMQLLTLTGGAQSMHAPPVYAVRTELDVNTAAEFPRALPSEKVADLLRELMHMSTEILREGDHP